MSQQPRADSALLGHVRRIVYGASNLYAGTPVADQIEQTRLRLDEPLRVAIAGRVKAGKSTLLNALVGQDLAATDAGECTRIVTWYQDGVSYRLTVYPRGGSPRQLPFARSGPATAIDLGGLNPDDVDRIVVDWPSPVLREMTLVDTPGMGSLSTELSERTHNVLAPDTEGAGFADAVIYLMRHMHSYDAKFLDAFHDDAAGRRPVNTIGVLSRADEIGHSRLDAMGSAQRIANRYKNDPRVRRLCQTVVPVAGLLGGSGATLRETEFRAFQLIAAAPEEESNRLLISAPRFANTETTIELTTGERIALVDRFGMFGVRFGVELVRTGQVRSATDLARELVATSGLPALRELLTVRIAGRAEVLKARSALLTLEAIARTHPHPNGEPFARDLEQVRASAHEFAEFQLIDDLTSGSIILSADDEADALRLLGLHGPQPHERLGVEPEAPPEAVSERLRSELGRWRRSSEDPTLPRSARDGARVLVRTCEGMLVAIGAYGQPSAAPAAVQLSE